MILPTTDTRPGPAVPTGRKLLVTAWVASGLLVSAAVAMVFSNVPTRVTPEDRMATDSLFRAYGIEPADPSDPREDQIKFINAVQQAILSAVSSGPGIPRGNPREPMDLLNVKTGLCYDRSRFIEKSLSASGFTVRHAFLFKARDNGSVSWADLLKTRIGSHAVTEVSVDGQWLVVGSNTKWLSLDMAGKIWSLDELENLGNIHGVSWDARYASDISGFWNYRFKSVYGLYSRHGGFYAPFNFLPDVNWVEFLQNF